MEGKLNQPLNCFFLATSFPWFIYGPGALLQQITIMKKPMLSLLVILSVGNTLAQVKPAVKKSVSGIGVKIGTQIWMKKNLDVATYRNGDPIPNITDTAKWKTMTTGAYCYYDNDSATYAAVYGKLYNWYAVNDSRGLAPLGWHVASDKEWFIIGDQLGGDHVAGMSMKEKGHAHWLADDYSATNSSGFTALPGGYREGNGFFYGLRSLGFWWTSSQTDLEGGGIFRNLSSSGNKLDNDGIEANYFFSVRCVKD
jgi:uncharacterized protein (TIGR02145 family)